MSFSAMRLLAATLATSAAGAQIRRAAVKVNMDIARKEYAARREWREAGSWKDWAANGADKTFDAVTNKCGAVHEVGKTEEDCRARIPAGGGMYYNPKYAGGWCRHIAPQCNKRVRDGYASGAWLKEDPGNGWTELPPDAATILAKIDGPELKVYEAYDWDVTYSMVIVEDCGESTVRKCAGKTAGCGAGEDNTYGFCGSPHATQHAKEIHLAGGRPGYFTGMCTDGTGRDGVAPSAACLGSAAHPNIANSTYRKLSWCVTPGDDHQFEGKAVPYKSAPEKCSDGEFGKCGETTCVADVHHPDHAAEEDADEDAATPLLVGDDHSTSADDHSTSADDHSTSADDHSTSADDHSTSADDHSTSAGAGDSPTSTGERVGGSPLEMTLTHSRWRVAGWWSEWPTPDSKFSTTKKCGAPASKEVSETECRQRIRNGGGMYYDPNAHGGYCRTIDPECKTQMVAGYDGGAQQLCYEFSETKTCASPWSKSPGKACTDFPCTEFPSSDFPFTGGNV